MTGPATTGGEMSSGKTDYKQSVRVATTANITLSGAQTIDGVSVVAGDRVLVKNQSSGANNGIWVCKAGAWARALDANKNNEMTSGMQVHVSEGTVNANTQWHLTTNDPITLGTTALAFAQSGGGISAAGAAALNAFLLTCGGATLGAPSAEAADARTVAVQLKDHLGADMAARTAVMAYVSTDATGDAPGDGALTIALTAGTDGALIGTDESGTWFVSEVDGDLDIVLTDAADGAATVYLHIVLPTGARVASAAIAFADDTP